MKHAKFFPFTIFCAAIYVSMLLAAAKESKEIKFKSRDLEKVQEELRQKKQEKQKLFQETEDLSHAVKAGEAQIQSVEKTLYHTRKKNSEISQDLAVAKNRNDQYLSKIDHGKSGYAQSLKRYYVASILNGSTAIGPVVGRQTIHMRAADLRDLLIQKGEIQQDLQSLVDTQMTIREEVDRQENRLLTMKSGYENKERLLNKKMTRQEAIESEMRELEKTAQELASLIDILRSKARKEAEAEKMARLKKQASGHSPIPPRSLPWPLRGKVTMKFGRHENPSLGTPFFSNGIVIVAEDNQPVMAVADGKVLYAGQFVSYGAMTVLEHPGDWYTVYGHLSRWNVEKGQDVRKGDSVGVARSEPDGGTEAYFELRFYGKPTDPLPWLSQ